VKPRLWYSRTAAANAGFTHSLTTVPGATAVIQPSTASSKRPPTPAPRAVRADVRAHHADQPMVVSLGDPGRHVAAQRAGPRSVDPDLVGERALLLHRRAEGQPVRGQRQQADPLHLTPV